MARKKSKEELNLDNVELDENGEPVESKGSKLTSFLVGLVVVIIWLVIFALLIKMDVCRLSPANDLLLSVPCPQRGFLPE